MRCTKPCGWMVAALLCVFCGQLSAQQVDPDTEAFYRAMSEHFEVPLDEARTLSRWGLPDDQLPVLLFMARHAGVSTDALAAQKKGGRSWADLADRYAVSTSEFYVSIPDDAGPVPLLAEAYTRFREVPRSEWASIRLSDSEITALVNTGFLSDKLDIPPMRVLQEAERAGSFSAAYPRLTRS